MFVITESASQELHQGIHSFLLAEADRDLLQVNHVHILQSLYDLAVFLKR